MVRLLTPEEHYAFYKVLLNVEVSLKEFIIFMRVATLDEIKSRTDLLKRG